MALYEAELSDGTIVELESDHEPSESEIISEVSGVEAAQPPTAPLPPPSGFPADDDPRKVAIQREQDWLRMQPRPTAWEGFKENLSDVTGDVGRSFFNTLVASPLKTAGVIASDPWRASANMGRGLLDFIAPGAMKFTGESGLTPPTAPPEQQPVYQAGKGAEEFLSETFPPPQDPELSRSVAEGFGQMGAMMLGGAGARALGAGGKGAGLAATTLGSTAEFDDAFTRARRRGDDPDESLKKALGYTTIAAMIENRLGAGRILRQLFPSAVEAAKKLTALGVSKKIIGNFISGGLEEAGQRGAQNWIVDEKLSAEGMLEEGIPGAIVQGITGLPGAGVRGSSEQDQPLVTAQQPLAVETPENVLRQAEETFNQRTPDAVQQEATGTVRDVQQSEVAQESPGQVPADEGSEEVTETRVEETPETIAEELGMVVRTLPASVPGQKVGWDFKFKLPGVDMFSVTVPAGTSKADIIKARDKKELLLKQLGEWPMTPTEIAKTANELQTAIRVGGKPISSPDKGHSALANELKSREEKVEALLPENQGFTWRGEFLSREDAAKILGRTGKLISEDLATIRKELGGEVTSEKAKEETGVLTIVPKEVRDALNTWRAAEKRYRRALRQEPSDRAEASDARDVAEMEFRGIAEKNGITQSQFDELRSLAKETDTESMPAVGFFPRQSESLGLGEPALPPTVETVRQQREQEQREGSPTAPGEKTTPSQGQWFAGDNPTETARMMQSRANFFLNGRSDEQAIVDLARWAGGDPSIQLDPQAANFAIKDLLVKLYARINSTKNPVDQQAAWNQIDRLAELSRRMGSEDARSLVSRRLAYRQIDWLMPVLAWRNIVQEQWRDALGIGPSESIDEAIAKLPKEQKDKLLKRLPELDGEKAKKLEELSKKAKTEPPGIRRNKVMDEMVKLLQSDSRISKTDLLRDVWYAHVLMRGGTMLNVIAGSYATGASFAALAAIDRLVRLHPVQAMRIIGQFIGGTIEGAVVADQIARKGAYHLLPDAEQRMTGLLTGKAGTRFDNLEELLRRGPLKNPLAIGAYTRRFMAALDYIGALGTRDAMVLYGALTQNDQDSLDAFEKRHDKEFTRNAAQQAKDEMGPKASRAEVMIRKREILEEGISEELKDSAIQTSRRAAQVADPRGIPGVLYNAAKKLPFWVKVPTGLAFMRSAMNMVQNAVDYTPGIGAISAARASLPENHPLRRMGLGLDIPQEERRMMWAAQGASLGIAAIASAIFLGDDDDDKEGMEISGGWKGLTPKERSQLMDQGERPYSIRMGKDGPWISYKQMPFAPPLAMVGTARDQQRFNKKKWDAASWGEKLTAAYLNGLLYVRDISSLSGVAGMFDANAWSTQESPLNAEDKMNRWAAQSIGRGASGYIPSVIKEIDEFSDPTLYRPNKDEAFGWWLRNVPYARRTVGPGPALNAFGEPIQTTRPPIKAWAGFGKDGELYETLGNLASKGIFLPEPGKTAKIVDNKGTYRDMTEDEWYEFVKTRGPLFKANFSDANIKSLRDANPDTSIKWLSRVSEKASEDARLRMFPLTRVDVLRREQPAPAPPR